MQAVIFCSKLSCSAKKSPPAGLGARTLTSERNSRHCASASGGKAAAAVTDSGEIKCGQLILATGHSARDTYAYLMNSGFAVVPKPFSVGVRIEHLRKDIERAIFRGEAGNPKLGHAEYALSKRVGSECVYTFCMCPGGEVIAAASETGGVCTNGSFLFAISNSI